MFLDGRGLKYPSPVIALLVLIGIFGFPKLPVIGMPIGAVIFILDWRNFSRALSSSVGVFQLIALTIFASYVGLRVVGGDGGWAELSFLFNMVYKVVCGIYLAFVLLYLMEERANLLRYFLFIQLFLIAVSALNEQLYSFLLVFQTSSANEVFDNTFGLRSLGFGVIHNEGIVTLALLYAILVGVRRSGGVGWLLSILIYASVLSSRLALGIIPIAQVLWQPVRLLVVIALLFLIPMYVDVTDGVVAQAFEFYNRYMESGVVGSSSTDALVEMPMLPDSLSTWIVGDGLLFKDGLFYKETDIGFSRLLFFGGLPAISMYLFLFISPLLAIERKWSNLDTRSAVLLGFLCYVFVVGNIKGFTVVNWAVCLFALLVRARDVGENLQPVLRRD